MKLALAMLGAIAFAAPALPQGSIFGNGQRGPNKPGPVKHKADGTPDLEGYWYSQVPGAVYGIEEHPGAFALFGGKSIIVDPPDGKIPYQDWARAKAQDLRAHHMAEEPEAHCSESGVPHQVWAQFGFQILQPRGYVVMLWEFMHSNRIIAMDGRPHADAKIKLTQGDSLGKWEGDTLVIDTTNLNDKTWFDAAGNFHSDAEKVVERFKPVDSDTIDYQATIEDPKVFTRKWTVGFQLWRNPDPHFEQMEFACREGQVDLQHIDQPPK